MPAGRERSWAAVRSLMRDMKKIPEDAVLIAVNHHGLEYRSVQITPSSWTIVISTPRGLGTDPCATAGLLVSRQPESDVDLGGSDWWQARFSGQLACWFACWIGCDPVILCGMNLYRNEPPTIEEVKNLAYQAPLEEHLKEWRYAFKNCPTPGEDQGGQRAAGENVWIVSAETLVYTLTNKYLHTLY